MEENVQVNEDQLKQEIYNFTAEQIVNGKSDTEIVTLLAQEKGMNEAAANQVISELKVEITNIRKKEARKNIISGALWCVGGTVVTAVTYSNASGGGRYVVAWGAVIFGGIQFIRGLVQMGKA